MTHRVLLAMIDIAHRDNAVALCRELSEQDRDGDTLHVAYVMPYGHYSYIEPFVSEDSIKAAAARAHDEVHAIVEETGLSFVTEHVLRGGVGEQALLLADEVKADMILVNAHRPKASAHVLGSYAAQIIRHAPCSVLVKR